MLKSIGKHALIYGVGMVLSRAVSFLMLPIYTRYLTPADYGVMALIEMTLDFIAIIGGSQLALGVFRFYHKTDDERDRREIVSTSFAMVGALYALISVVVFMSAGPMSQVLFGNADNTLVIRIAALNLGTQSLLIVPLSLARVQELSTLFVGANATKLVVSVGLNLLLVVWLRMGVMGIFLSSLASNALVGGVLGVWLVRKVGVTISGRWTRDLLRYGVPLMGMQVATFMATFSDRYFLQALGDESVVGLYSLAYQFGFLLVMVGFTPIDMVWGPKRFEVARRPDGKDVLARAFVGISVLLLTVAMGITVYVGDVLWIMATPAFHSAADVVPVILIAYVLQCWASVQDVGILIAERTEFLTLANVLSAVVAVGGYAVLVPRYMEWGAASATVIAFLVRYLTTYYFSQRLWPVRYRWRPVATVVVWSGSVAAAALALPTMPVVQSLAVRTGLVALYFVGLWFLPILGEDGRRAVAGMASALGITVDRAET